MISVTPALCIVGANGPSLYGLTSPERLRRQFERAGVSAVLSPEAAAHHGGPVIVVRAAAVIDQPLIAALIATPQLLLMGNGSKGEMPLAAHVEPRDVSAACQALANGAIDVAGLRLNARSPSELDVKFWKALRKRETPYAFAVDAANAALSNGACSWAPTRVRPTSSPSMSGRCPPSTRPAPGAAAASRPTW